MERPIVLAIGGWDPSGGAGLAADIKTLEAHNVTGMGVATAITFQSENRFWGLQWIELKDIVSQFKSIVNQHNISAIKIGLIENPNVVGELLSRLDVESRKIPIVWDPILKASAGFEFHENTLGFDQLLKKVTLITPNAHEAKIIFGEEINTSHLIQLINKNEWGAVLLKGGHALTHASDSLLTGTTCQTIVGDRFNNCGKHGSGCVLSSAIAANLSKGMALPAACLAAKRYVERFILSSETLLGRHLPDNTESLTAADPIVNNHNI